MPCFGTFLDVAHFPRGVKSSNLFLRHSSTSVDVVEGLDEARMDNSRLSHSLDVPKFKIELLESLFWHVSGRNSLSTGS